LKVLRITKKVKIYVFIEERKKYLQNHPYVHPNLARLDCQCAQADP